MKLRFAKESDFEFILQANRDINSHSHQSEIDSQNQNRLKNDIFGKNPKCWVIIAETDNKPVGMALYATTYFANDGQIMWVSQIYVLPEYRRHIATGLLMKKLSEIAIQNNWPFICSGIDNGNLVSQKTLFRAGGKSLENFRLYSVPVRKFP